MRHAIFTLLLSAAALAGCDGQGGGGQGGGCRDSGSCPAGEGCVGPEDVVCGIPPREDCFTDADCQGAVCHSIFDACSPDHVGSSCGPPCAQDVDCGGGFVCSAGGSCAPAPCDAAGGACLPSETCDPSAIDPAAPVPDRTDGCARIDCASDDACPDGTVCVNGRCQTGLGTCMGPVP